MDLVQVWKTTLAQIEVKLDSPAQFRTWFKDTRLIEVADATAKIGVKNSYTGDWLKKKHDTLIQDTISYVYGSQLSTEYIYDKEAVNQEAQRLEEETTQDAPLLGVRLGVDEYTHQKLKNSGLNDKYTFSNFIVGSSNRLAQAAAISVANNIGTSYNPLFIYGNTGFGKTHLAQAVGRHVIDKHPNNQVFYTPSESFLNDMVQAIRTNKTLDFRKKYRELDLLIIDDIQFISNWEETQNEFFNTFNVLYQSNKQIILTSDKPPAQIENLERRLVSRFQGGMVVDISAPDIETRIAILEQKKLDFGYEIHEQTIRYIARIVDSNVRELEGALQKIALLSTMKPENLTFEEVRSILGKDPSARRHASNPQKIIKAVAKEFDLKVVDLKGPRRTKDIAFARQLVMYILRDELGYKLEQTAQFLNRSDHTTVIHAVDKIKSMLLVNATFQNQVNNILATVRDSEI